MVSEDEKLIILNIKKSEEKTFEAFFKRTHQKVYQFVLHFIRREDVAACIVQDTYISIWEHRANLDENKSLSAYLFLTAKNKVLNHIRKTVNEKVYKEYIEHTGETSENTTESDLRYIELEKLIQKIINDLPQRRREIFMLSMNAGLSYKEIAVELNISENTVDTQIRNALNYLRKNISSYLKS